MTKTEYMEKLEQKLHVLPGNERHKALEYYEGYFSFAESEEAAIEQLGTPGDVAAKILADYLSRANAPLPPQPEVVGSTDTGGSNTGRNLLIAILTFPLWLPLVIIIASLVFSVVVTGGALLIAGIAVLFASPFVLFKDFGLAMYMGGTGFITLGLGILFLQLFKFIAKGIPSLRRRVSHGR